MSRMAIAMGLNLNWLFDPATAFARGEPLLRNVMAIAGR